MTLDVLPASKGDCMILSWEEKGKEHQIIIDGGIQGTYKYIKKHFTKKLYLDGVFITHVDYDHVGGLLKMLEDSSFNLNYNFPFFVNSPELIICPSEKDKVAYKHGILLNKLLEKRKIKKIPLYTDLYPNNEYIIHGLKLTILSPTYEILKELKSKWTAAEIKDQYIKEQQGNDKVRTELPALKPYDDIIQEKESIINWKHDLINSSSIAFIAEHNGKSILFLGDSNPEIIATSIEGLGYNHSQKLILDLVKISHHGSIHNTSKNLLKLLSCNNFLISTNGKGPYYHPNRETIIKIAEYSRCKKNEPINIYTNYTLNKRNILLTEEETIKKIYIQKKIHFTF